MKIRFFISSMFVATALLAQSSNAVSPSKPASSSMATSVTFATAKRNALDLVGALVNDGFRVRDGDWMVTLIPKKPVFLQVTLFAGNQYWFAAAVTPPGDKLKLSTYDATGHSIKLDTWCDNEAVSGAKIAGGFIAPKSGKYFVGIELVDSKENTKADACLIYAYK